MLKRIKIQGYKSLVDVEVHLGHLAVLIGPNASGKSNFLDALQLLSRIATCRTLREAFAPHRGYPLESFTFGPEGIKTLRQQEKVSFCIETDVQLSPTVVEKVNRQIQRMKSIPTTDVGDKGNSTSKRLLPVREGNLRYRIEIEMLPKQGILRVADEYLAALNAKGEVKQNRKPFLERVGSQILMRLEGEARSICYDCPLDQSILSMQYSPIHYPHIAAMHHELANWFTHYFEPRERMRLPAPAKEVTHIGSMGEELASYLHTLKTHNERQFESIEKALHSIIPSITGIEVDISELGEAELNLREGEKGMSIRVLSEGTLRILGLLALVGSKEPPALIGFEEPENSVHPRQINRIAKFLDARRLLERTQYIVTTHSSLLLEFIRPEFFYVCRKVDGNTTIESFLTRMQSLWPKLDINEELENEDEMSRPKRILRGDLDV
ncbi:MAG: AAA family ATPase [Candidatus Poribacteria bacterium]|nr:AAA family ATPase [Candidatus Poribacteria bacterium]